MNGADRPRRLATVAQVRRILEHHLEALWSDPQHAVTLPPLMLWGAPGVGKSAVIRTVAADRQIGFVDVRLSQREPVDIRGLPVPTEEGVRWLTSAEWPRSGRGILLFDELTAADRSLQVAAYEFILDRRLGDLYRVPDGWYLCAAGNRSEDGAVTSMLSSALANRFCHLEIEPDIEDWMAWARAVPLHPDVVGFLRFEPRWLFQLSGETQQGWPSPRSWERVSLELEHAAHRKLDDDSLALILQGLVGPVAATEFVAFRSWSRHLPSVLDMMQGKISRVIPERTEQRYALACAAAYHARRQPELLGGLLALCGAMPTDFALMCVLDYLGGDDERGVERRTQALTAHPAFRDWKRRHGRVLAVRVPSMAGQEGPEGV